jgi:hypothetical protein
MKNNKIFVNMNIKGVTILGTDKKIYMSKNALLTFQQNFSTHSLDTDHAILKNNEKKNYFKIQAKYCKKYRNTPYLGSLINPTISKNLRLNLFIRRT